MNKYKILSIVFILIILGLSINLYNKQQTYDLGVFEIKKSQLNELSEAVDNNNFLLCQINQNKCVRINKIK